MLKTAVATVRRRIPEPLRRSVDRFRPLPNFLIIGAMKGGTTSLHEHLARHPRVAFGRIKEVQFFSHHYSKGVKFYRSHFPVFRVGRNLIGDATPAYLFHPLAAERIKRTLPAVKMIALLRNPVDRAISDYFHQRRKGRETLPIDEAMEAEEERRRSFNPGSEGLGAESRDPFFYLSYKLRGHYLEQIERFWKLFPKEQLMILRSEDFFADPRSALAKICRFLGVSDLGDWGELRAVNVGENRTDVPDQVRTRLREYFAPHNRRLEDALGQKLNWD